jgi:hypothetical protein
MVASMADFLNKSRQICAHYIVSGEATELIGSYNALVLDRNRILKSATDVNPTVIKMNEQLSSLIKCKQV